MWQRKLTKLYVANRSLLGSHSLYEKYGLTPSRIKSNFGETLIVMRSVNFACG